MKNNSNLAALLGVGLIGSNFFSLILLSRSNSIPSLGQLATTNNSSSQLRYKKEGDTTEIMMRHNMNDPKLALESIQRESPSWGGKVKTSYVHRETLASNPVKALSAEQIQCIKDRGSAESQGEIVGQSLITATPAASTLSGIPVVGWITSALATKKAGELGKEIGGDFVDC